MSDCSDIFWRFPGICIEKTSFEEFQEIGEQINKELEIQYNDEKEMIDLLTNVFLNIY